MPFSQEGTRAYCSEHGRCGWTGTKPRRPDTNTLLHARYPERRL